MAQWRRMLVSCARGSGLDPQEKKKREMEGRHYNHLVPLSTAFRAVERKGAEIVSGFYTLEVEHKPNFI